MSKIIIHCIGGAGINIGYTLYNKLGHLGEGYADVEYHWVDTSLANNAKVTACGGKLKRVTTNRSHGLGINGSGGERSTNAKDLQDAMKEYMDVNKWYRDDVNTTHVVLFSLSGGTGAVAGPVLIQELMRKQMTVVAIAIGDSKDLITCRNSINTLKTLGVMANKNNATLSLFYRLNAYGTSYAVDADILQYMETLRLFLSGLNNDLDIQDIRNLLNQKNYKTISVPSGVYMVSRVVGAITKPVVGDITTSRTLLLGNGVYESSVTVMHEKVGSVPTVIDTSIADVSISLVSVNGALTNVISKLETDKDILERVETGLVKEEFEVSDDDDGLIL